MSERDGRTEKGTGKKRSDARKKGQVARSHDVNSTAGLLAVFAVLVIGAPRLMSQFKELLATALSRSGDGALVSSSGVGPLMVSSLKSFALMIAPIVFAAAIAGVAANIAQVRWKWSAEALRPKFSHLNPLKGIKRVFGPSGLVETVKALIKLGAIGGIAFMAVWSQMPQLGSLVGIPPSELMSQLGRRVEGITFRVMGILIVLALGDWLWQRRKFEQAIKMTKEEVKQEARQTDLAPEVRGAIRRKQFQQARRRMLADVPTADVVIVNPTHYAVALRYDSALPAPEVVAKGADHIAAAIRAAAKEHDVPLVHNPPLARTLYRDVEVGALLPEALFVAVAEVLAYVYRTAGARGRARRRKAALTAAQRS